MRKPTFCICENKDAEQLRGNREADQRLCFRYIDSTVPLQSISKLFESRVIASIDEYTQIVKQNSEHTTACYKNRYLVYLNSSVNMILFYEWSRQFRVMKRVEIKYFNANICHLFQIRLFVSDCHLLICYCLLNPFDRCHSMEVRQ